MTIARRLVLSGHVQGVWFRDWAVREATRIGLRGWVRNLDDGRVEAMLEGETAAVDAMIALCRVGPEHARVEDMRVHDAPVAGHDGFVRRADGQARRAAIR